MGAKVLPDLRCALVEKEMLIYCSALVGRVTQEIFLTGEKTIFSNIHT